MKKLVLAAALLAAAAFVLVAGTLPRRRLALAAFPDGTIPGILHVHTNRSDGRSSPDEVAVAASRAGLKFVVFTDHGDGTRKPDPPTYRADVLCLDGVEISTNGGHYVGIDMPAAPYPLGGDARDVVEDVRRLGGFGIVAHPDSPKPQLRWRDWEAPFDGIELLNPDTSWRVLAAQSGWASKRKLVTAIIDYPFRSTEVIGGLIQPPDVLDQWEWAAARRRVVTIAGADAHARLALRSADPADSWPALPLPGYETAFHVMSVHVRTERRLSGDAGSDGAMLLRAIRNGHLYTALDSLASPPSFEFSATNAKGAAEDGDELGVGGAVQLHVHSNAPREFQIIVHQDRKVISSVRDAPDLVVHASDRPAVYWVEIVDASRTPPLTWIRSNAIYVRGPSPDHAPSERPKAATLAIFDGRSTGGWSVEHDQMSVGAVDLAASGTDAADGELRFRYGLAGGAAAGQVTALALNTPRGIGSYERLTFTGRSERPARVSVQLRDEAGHRWERSVYLDPAPREVTIVFGDFLPIASAAPEQPPLGGVRTLLFVVDTTNSRPGSSGRIWIKRAALERLATSAR